MNILMVYPPCRETVPPAPPLGLLYVAQPLLEDGHHIDFFDIALEKPSREEVLLKIKDKKFDLMMIGGIITTYSYVKWLTNEVRKIHPYIPIIGGGFVATPIPHLIFKNTGINVVCNGEGDITTREYVAALDEGKDISKVYGLFIKNENSFFKTPERPLVSNLDEIHLPLDAYKLLDMERYIINENGKQLQHQLESYGMWDSYLNECRVFDILSERGCVAHCTFCYRMMKGLRKHSVPYLIDHIKYLSETYRVNLFQFIDELFVSNKKWIDEFCIAIKENNIDIRFRINLRANMITDELLTRLKSVGCIDIGVGFESGSQRMLDEMKKHTRVEDNYRVYRLLKKYNMILGANTMQGMPGETQKSLMETLKFIQECKIDNAACNYVTAYPDSDLYRYVLKQGLIKDEDAYLEWIADSDACEFKLNLTQLPDSDLIYYHWLLADALRKNKFRDELDNAKIGITEYYKFLIKHYGIRVLYHIGLFKVAWNLKNNLNLKREQ